jgi:hypothetical protein
VDLNTTLVGFENHLRLDIKEPIDVQIQGCIADLENSWSVNLDNRSIFEIRIENPMAQESIDPFVAQLIECCKNIAYLCHTNIFFEEYGITLRDVNYLGFDRDRLASCLCYLMRKTLYSSRTAFFDSILAAASRIDISTIRRLIAIMGAMERLGFSEGVSIVAQYLYVGLKVQ